MVQSCLLLRGRQENQSEGTPLPSGGGGDGFINPVLALLKFDPYIEMKGLLKNTI